MCIKGKHLFNHWAIGLFWGRVFLALGAAYAGEVKGIAGVQLAENLGGMSDRVYVSAPPSSQYVLSLERGSFLDCGAGMAVYQTDADGRSMAPLNCGVTLTETLVIPSASKPARLIIHY